MSYCINPNCSKPQNSDTTLFCQACGSDLLLEGRYRVKSQLGSGGFGTTYEIDDSGKLKILKALHNNLPKAVELFEQEARVLMQLHHPGIPRVEANGYFTYLPNNSYAPLHCLVMEKIEGMNLQQWLTQRNNQAISERIALSWLNQLAEILHSVHQQQYFHRDIKLSNIMLSPDEKLVLIDFGTAREVTQTFFQQLKGEQVTGIISAGYTPPEQMNGKAVPQSDFFALGRTFVYLLTGKHPNNFPEDSRTGELIWRNDAPQVSKLVADFIDYLMAPFPGNRPQDTQELLQRLAEVERYLDTPQLLPQNLQIQHDSTTVTTPRKGLSSQSNNKFFVGVAVLLAGLAGVAYRYWHFNGNPRSTNSCVVVVADPDPPLNVRYSPEVKPDNKVGSIQNGTPLSVVNEQNGWFQINSPIKGWVAGNRTKNLCNR